MKGKNYTSKRIGNITISVQENYLSIKTARLELRSLNQSTEALLIENYASLLGNPDNVKLFGKGDVWAKEQVEEFVKNETLKWNAGERFGIFAIYDAKTRQFMGSLYLDHVLDEYTRVGIGHPNVAEIGYILDQAFWGKGYGTELAIAAKKYIKHIISKANNTLENPPTEIFATAHPENKGSIGILRKTLKNQDDVELFKYDGQPRLLFFKILKTDKTPILDSNSDSSLLKI